MDESRALRVSMRHRVNEADMKRVESLADTPPDRQWLFVSQAGADSSFSGEGACEAEAGNGFLQK